MPLHTIGGQGVFVKEVQQAVLDGRRRRRGALGKGPARARRRRLHIAAYCARRDAADALIGRRLAELDRGAPSWQRLGAPPRPTAAVRPDLQFVELRGNIARRLEKVPPRGAIVMAVAALEVLGLTDRIAERLDPTVFVPAVGQGCVAVECRADDASTTDALAGVDDASTRFAVSIERAFLAELGAGCSLPLGAYCVGGRLHGFLAAPDADSRRPETQSQFRRPRLQAVWRRRRPGAARSAVAACSEPAVVE